MTTKLRHYLGLAAIGSLVLAGGCAQSGEEDIDLSEVPENVMAAASGAVDGIEITEAEVEEIDGLPVYELDGSANGVDYEIEVAADGTVLSVEEE